MVDGVGLVHRAIYHHHGQPEIITGCIASDGTLEAGQIKLKSNQLRYTD